MRHISILQHVLNCVMITIIIFRGRNKAKADERKGRSFLVTQFLQSDCHNKVLDHQDRFFSPINTHTNKPELEVYVWC